MHKNLIPRYFCQWSYDESNPESWHGLCPDCANAPYTLLEEKPVKQLYPVGFIGRTTCLVTALAADVKDVEVPEGSLARVASPGVAVDKPTADDDCIRYTVVFLTENGKDDPRGLSYDGAWRRGWRPFC